MNQNQTEKTVQFEAQLARLEEIVKSMENGEETLDSMLALFEEGIGLVKSCSDILEKAEQKVSLLTRGKDGEWNEHDFETAE